MGNQSKRILAIFLSVILAFSTVPLSLVSGATLNNSNVTVVDITDSAILKNLNVSSSVPTLLKTQFAADAFETRKENNLLRKAQVLGFYTDAEGTTSLKKELGSNSGKDVVLSPKTLYDGIVAYYRDGSNIEPQYLTTGYEQVNSNFGYLTIELDDSYDISDLYISSGFKSKNVTYNYDIYISNDKEHLYQADNKIISYDYLGYANDEWTGKINLEGITYAEDGTTITNANAETNEFVLKETVRGKYVGFYFKAFGMQTNYERIFEIGVEGSVVEGNLSARNVTSDITDALTISKLRVTSAVKTTLKTQFGTNAFAERSEINLLKDATEFNMYSDPEMSSIMTYKDTSLGSVALDNAAMCDGVVSTNLSEGNRMTTNYTNVNSEPAYVLISLDRAYDIGKFYLATRENCRESVDEYEIYISKNREGLFSTDNKIVHFEYSGYIMDDLSTKINKVIESDATGELEVYPSEIEEYHFGEPIVGQYVGIKIKSFGVNENFYVRISEIGIEEYEYFKLDESELNVNVQINPLKNYFNGEDYSFKVSVTNGGILNHLYLDGAEIVPDGNGIYNVKNATSDMKLTADFELDEKKTISLGVGSDETERNITWHTLSNTVGKVQYAEKSGNGFPEVYSEATAVTYISKNDVGYYVNKAVITDLKPDTEYVYRLVNDKTSEIYSFKTSPKNNFSFLVAGDPQLYDGSLDKWTNTLNKATNAFPESKLLISLGDQAEESRESEYSLYFAPSAMTSLTNATVIGNHDTKSSSYSEHFHNPNKTIDGVSYGSTIAGENYWYVYNNILFLNLNSNNDIIGEHKAFMEKAIAANPDVTWKVVTMHHCIYSGGHYFTEYYVSSLREKLVPIFNELDIDIVFTGHNHLYTRSYMMNGFEPDLAAGAQSKVVDPTGIVYITAGSSTGTKYYDVENNSPTDHVAVKGENKNPSIINVEVAANSFKMTTYNLNDMSVIDSFEIEKSSAQEVHDPKHITAKPASCQVEGYKEHWVCDICEKMFSDAECKNEVTDVSIPKLKHIEITVSGKAPTCTATGLTAGVKCSKCGDTLTEQKTIPALGHKNVTLAAVKATCTTAGKTAGTKCSVCRKVTKAQTTVKALGHKSDSGKVTKAATYDATGVKTYTCTVCKKVIKTETIAKKAKTSLKKATITVKDQTYSGKVKTPSITVKLNGKTLKKNTDYTVSYKNNKSIGKATVTIKGIKAYKDTASKTFKINPKKVTDLKLKSSKKKELTVSWKKDSKVSGYEIVYATNSKLTKGKKTVKVTSYKTYKKTIKKLTSKKTYYVKVRSYKTVSGKKYYSAYTSVKKLKIK